MMAYFMCILRISSDSEPAFNHQKLNYINVSDLEITILKVLLLIFVIFYKIVLHIKKEILSLI